MQRRRFFGLPFCLRKRRDALLRIKGRFRAESVSNRILEREHLQVKTQLLKPGGRPAQRSDRTIQEHATTPPREMPDDNDCLSSCAYESCCNVRMYKASAEVHKVQLVEYVPVATCADEAPTSRSSVLHRERFRWRYLYASGDDQRAYIAAYKLPAANTDQQKHLSLGTYRHSRTDHPCTQHIKQRVFNLWSV